MMEILNKTKKTKKEMMDEQSASGIIKDWSDILEVRLKGDDYEEMKDEIILAVQKERLILDIESEVFTYLLLKPIVKKDGSGQIDMVKIYEPEQNEKRNIANFKNENDKGIATISAYIVDSEGNKIEHGFLNRLKDRDINIITAVILGFFVQAVPGKVS